MFKDFAAKVATVTATLLLSATCLMGAIAPGITDGPQAVASAARLMA